MTEPLPHDPVAPDVIALDARFGPLSALVPDAPDARAQVIDVDDVAAFAVVLGQERFTGAVNIAGESLPLADVIAAARAVAGHTGDLVPAPSEWLVAQGVAYWAGPRSLPRHVPA